ncbi:MAG: family 43 glycosylhydrolase [Trueperaceae bacterium]|nr:family 43 glycosylhydrolase [Trueperaceae bacterium]
MALSLSDKWLWDFWFARDGADYHVFYLQAPKSLEHESQRHFNVSIGHAVSQDLKTWTVLADALKPSDPALDALDNYTTWTGSILKYEGLWYMFYTGSSLQEKGLIQRIFLATSGNLLDWQKYGPPVIEADPRWYEKLDLTIWLDEAWRDPFVCQDETGLFHAFITARANEGPADARGVIGHATSKDLLSWQVRPPVSPGGDFAYLEVPQVSRLKGGYYLLFAVTHDKFSKTRLERSKPETGMHYLRADKLTGPYKLMQDKFMLADTSGSLYSGKFLYDPRGNLVFMAFENYSPEGKFIGSLTDPFPVTQLSDGRLEVDLSSKFEMTP